MGDPELMNLPAIREAANQRLHDLLAHLLPAGTPRGNEYLIGDEHGAAGDSCAIVLTGDRVGLWHDHASGHGGDVLDLVAVHHGPTVGHAARWLATWLGRPDLLNGDAAAEWTPHDARWKRAEDAEWSAPQAVYTYRDRAGAVLGYVCRYPNGKGIPLGLNRKHKRWWSKPAPLYGAQDLNDDRPILVVEGEKTRDAAAKLFRDHAVVTWPGGSTAVCDADWSALTGRTVVIWPDADKPGRRAANYLKSRFPDARVIPTEDLPDGWDLADDPPNGFDPVGRLHAEPVAEPPPPSEPFRVLGVADSELFFHSYRSGDIITLTPTALTELNLQLLAPDSYWESRGFHQRDGGIDYRAVAKYLIDAAHAAGRFTPDRIRGRGCWIDPHPVTHAPRVVFNAGDRIYVDGVLIQGQPDSRYSYRAGKPIAIDLSTPATREDGLLLERMCNLLPYSSSTRPWVLPAVLFLGPVSGVLDYRPGVWIDGESGSGKSTVYSEFFGRLWAGCSFLFTGATSEAGIRQDVGSDALPCTFDEAEARTARAAGRLDAVLELIRQSSTETGGRIVKGSASGSAVTFEVRSLFALFSIAAPAMETADESRLARVTLTTNHDRAKYAELLDLLTRVTPEFCMRIRARAVLSALRIRASYEVFRRVIAEQSKSSRKGQQFGSIAAGLWCLTNDRPPTEAEAAFFASREQWDDLGAGTAENSDQQQCLAHLLQHRTYWQDGDGRRHDESVAGLIRLAAESETHASDAKHALNLMGLHVTPSGLHVANKHAGLSAVFRNTQFAERWKDYLKRIPGAEAISIKVNGTKGWYVRIETPPA